MRGLRDALAYFAMARAAKIATFDAGVTLKPCVASGTTHRHSRLLVPQSGRQPIHVRNRQCTRLIASGCVQGGTESSSPGKRD